MNLTGWLTIWSREDGNAPRSDAGWAEARDRFPGRVDRASAGRGDGTAGHRDSVVNRRDPWPAAGHPLERKCGGSHEQRNAQRSDAGWVTSRDRLHGRLVARRWVVEMAPGVGRNTAVDGRVRDPDPRRKQACARSPGTARGSRTRTTIFVAAAAPDRGASKRVRGLSNGRSGTPDGIFAAAAGPDPRRQQACARCSRAPQLVARC